MSFTVYEYDDGRQVITVELGLGDVGIAPVIWEDGRAGVSFSPIETAGIGGEVCGKRKEKAEGETYFQIVSTSRESLEVLRKQVAKAIELFDKTGE